MFTARKWMFIICHPIRARRFVRAATAPTPW